jgi:nucleoside-diphosphate-sugar epimerase
MKILVTGASGFIGQNICQNLEKKHIVYKVFRNKKLFFGENNFEVDLTDKKSIFQSGLFKLNVDLIIHCAGIISSSNFGQNFKLFYDNIIITENIIDISKKLNSPKIINLSTIGVYPNETGVYNELSLIKPSSNSECLYSLSKFCSEELLNFLLKETEVINLRLAQTYGTNMRSDRIYSEFLKELTDYNQITVWGNGERVSNFISIEYLIEIIIQIINKNLPPGTYNLGNKNISYYELAQLIISLYGNNSSKIITIEKGIKSKVFIESNKLIENLHS